MAAAMELQQGQKEAMAPQQAPPLFLGFSHGGNLSKMPTWLSFCWIMRSYAYLLCFLLQGGGGLGGRAAWRRPGGLAGVSLGGSGGMASEGACGQSTAAALFTQLQQAAAIT